MSKNMNIESSTMDTKNMVTLLEDAAAFFCELSPLVAGPSHKPERENVCLLHAENLRNIAAQVITND